MSIPDPAAPAATVAPTATAPALGSPTPDEADPSVYCQVVTTMASQEQADRLAAGIIEARLAGCVQILGPVRSVYRWNNQVTFDEEWQCVIKTTTARLNTLTAHIRAQHDYEVPEIIATPIFGGNEDYLDWLSAETTAS
ncbi:divalent-cation tolerance protein CutA [Actinoalloteichus hymeniacidonis]|uniref:Divalent-cation tolerance protein CutA n=1 Tax=Actinoalloteichus hymeniacidonis TaxID=340345 RepID=A0AAC9N0H5_9PSEU|nr:divalent-cation tolerance protein CutA [Actinoalloteichus hymeniacidonis]AOS65370.1 hypothetical protein TL08_22950 [Actinoalloteichus hymeniacidonis]MBB5906544.1 periplasmic divalent cation tolerance protein [Actinoalloteichus hymeniacidonis]